jgi:predicted amidohydrolase
VNPKPTRMKVASSQFPVTSDIGLNAKYIARHIRTAAARGTDAILFPEGALSGYGRSRMSFEGYDWGRLRGATEGIVEVARECRIWVFVGSAHFLSPTERPTNSLYIISPKGEVVDRYDKSMLIGHEFERYSGGSHPVMLDLHGWKCGFAICYDSHFPEIFSRYRQLGVQILFLSMNCAGAEELSPHVKLLSELAPAQFRTRATDNRMWIVVSNSSAAHSCAPAMVVRPDGSVQAMRRNRAGLLYHEFPDENIGMLYNNKMMKLPKNEVFHNGIPSSHARALNRQSLP